MKKTLKPDGGIKRRREPQVNAQAERIDRAWRA